jgi:flagellar biosynthesis chaperone FliJ
MTSKRLARLVRLKELAEQARATELLEQRQSLSRAEADLAYTQGQMDSVGHTGGVMTGSELTVISDYREHLNHRAQLESQVIRKRTSDVREAEGAVFKAWGERRSMQSVHDRAASREELEERRLEQLEMEEMALNRSRRK